MIQLNRDYTRLQLRNVGCSVETILTDLNPVCLDFLLLLLLFFHVRSFWYPVGGFFFFNFFEVSKAKDDIICWATSLSILEKNYHLETYVVKCQTM